ncbi:MAG: erythromycin esterase family protein [Mediterranea sp.]|nr:erythromycin esterase family protein [Mediterranea sp.]
MKKLFVIIWLLPFLSTCQSKAIFDNYTHRYNLHYDSDSQKNGDVQGWRMSQRTFYSCVPMLMQKGERRFAVFEHLQDSMAHQGNRLWVDWSQRFPLPSKAIKEGQAILTHAGKEVEKAALIITGFDSNENLCYTERCPLAIAPDEFRTDTLCFSLSSMELIDFRIEVMGALDRDARFAVSGVDITLDGKPLDEYPLRVLNATLPTDFSRTIIPFELATAKGFDKLVELKKKRIIALGESVHGSKTMQESKYNIVEQQIADGRCKMLLLEESLSRSIWINKYVHVGDSLSEKKALQGEDASTKEFLRWIWNYNKDKKEEDKVQVWGMDWDIDAASQDKDIKDYVEAMDALSPADSACVTHIYHLSAMVGNDMGRRSMLRDSVMFANARFLIDDYLPKGKTAFILAHNGHVNLLSAYPAVQEGAPLGQMMRNYYQDDYYSIGMLVGGGFIYSLNEEKMRVEALPLYNLDTSLEASLNQVKGDVFFFHLPYEMDKLLMSRLQGTSCAARGYFPINLYRRHDGFIFIRHSEAENK